MTLFGMNVWKIVLLILVGWTLLGIAGIFISQVRREKDKVSSGIRWLLGVWVIYLTILLGVSVSQPRKSITIGQEQCYAEMCFTVRGVEELPRFLGRDGPGDGSRLLRVQVSVRNKGRESTHSEAQVRAYLVDAQGRRWEESQGVNGNRLTALVGPGSQIISQPMFKVPADATGLGLVFTHGKWQPGVLVIGDSDSWWHQKTVVWLGR